jgi:hypothetical protein
MYHLGWVPATTCHTLIYGYIKTARGVASNSYGVSLYSPRQVPLYLRMQAVILELPVYTRVNTNSSELSSHQELLNGAAGTKARLEDQINAHGELRNVYACS